MEVRMMLRIGIVVLAGCLTVISALPTDVISKPIIGGGCSGPPLQCFRCVTLAEYTGPCGCPLCSNPCQGILCPACVPATSAQAGQAQDVAAASPAIVSCCPKCG
ncbi:uncharacterized protein LOC129591819 [Paramacrobiotus metropolitanus]|uniref:uncharacterized protein LOC129591819 n=1 Tax=Paramacrobiotus metropolitanus TaxID=2943436 RepID=UPI0024458DC7|nr:uncharacterized protein LOC129591819 [Paramacrobiotus metropolitanus]